MIVDTTIVLEMLSTISLGDLLKQGGWAMWPLGLFSFLLIFLIIKNALMLREKGAQKRQYQMDQRLSHGKKINMWLDSFLDNYFLIDKS